MSAEAATTSIVDVPEASRFEIRVDGTMAGRVDYTLSPGLVTFVHTVIEEAFGGRGLGGVLARGVLDAARERGLAVRPDCPFIRGWIAKHPDYVDLVAQADRAHYDL